ncbi:hypothetical protein ACHAWX_006836 [Stephanocyclus meneghinianus]
MELLVYATNYIHYEVWTMPGSWRQLNTSHSAAFYASFSPVANGTMLGRGVCEDCGYSPLEEFQDVVIEGAKTVQSFWVTLASDNLVFKKRNKTPIAQSSCDSFVVNVGSAVLAYPLESVDPTLDLSDNNEFLGAIQYQSMFRDIAGTSHPTPSPLTSQSWNGTESPSMATAPSQSPATDTSYEPTYGTHNVTSFVPSLVPTLLNNFTTTLNSSLFPSPGPTFNESFDNFSNTSNVNTTTMNFTESTNASLPDTSNSSAAPTSVMFGNSTSAPSSSFSPSPWPSYNDTVMVDNEDESFENLTIASGNNTDNINHTTWPSYNDTLIVDNDDESSENLTIALGSNTDTINYTLSMNASSSYASNSSMAPTSALFGNSTDVPSSSFSASPRPSFHYTTSSHQDIISEDVTSETSKTNSSQIDNPSPVYNGTHIMNSTRKTPAPSPSSNSSSVPFSSFSPSPPSSYNATAPVDNGSKNSTGKISSNNTSLTLADTK